jgi:hypothetical protein
MTTYGNATAVTVQFETISTTDTYIECYVLDNDYTFDTLFVNRNNILVSKSQDLMCCEKVDEKQMTKIDITELAHLVVGAITTLSPVKAAHRYSECFIIVSFDVSLPRWHKIYESYSPVRDHV